MGPEKIQVWDEVMQALLIAKNGSTHLVEVRGIPPYITMALSVLSAAPPKPDQQINLEMPKRIYYRVPSFDFFPSEFLLYEEP